MLISSQQFPLIMGILNATPDSFSDGTGEVNIDLLFKKATLMLAEGVDIIDIGGETTKPGSEETPENVELERVLPILKLVKDASPNIQISIDTRKATVANECLKQGADIINDISGLQYSPEIADVVAKYDKQLIIMHSKSSPKNMQENPQYTDVVREVYGFLDKKIRFAKKQGVKKIIADIGIGFAKTTEHNLTLLQNLQYFTGLDVPQLLGISRKRFIGEITGIQEPQTRDASTMFLHSLLLNRSNIDIIRVHNVAMANHLRKIYQSIS